MSTATSRIQQYLKLFWACLNPFIIKWVLPMHGVIGALDLYHTHLPAPLNTLDIFDLFPSWSLLNWIAVAAIIVAIGLVDGYIWEVQLLEEGRSQSKRLLDSTGIPYRTAKTRGATRFVAPAMIVMVLAVAYFLLPQEFKKQESTSMEQTKPATPQQEPKATAEAPFHIELPVVITDRADNMLATQLMFGHGNVVSPINFALYVQIVNMQNVQSQIKAYSVEGAPTSDGPWKMLLRIPVGNGELYGVRGNKLTEVTVWQHRNDLTSVLTATAFAPHETRFGWVFFERRDVIQDEIRFFKFHIRDTARVETDQIVPSSNESSRSETNLHEAGFIKLKHSDISKFKFKYFFNHPN